MSANLNFTNFPEVWAAESVRILKNSIVMAPLVLRDYENLLGEYGDTVNIRRPDALTARSWAGQRNTDDIADSEITVEQPKAKNLAITLDQHYYTAMMEEKKDASLSVENIQRQFLEPGVVPLAEAMDLFIINLFVTGTDIDGASVGMTDRGAAFAAENMVDVFTALNNQKCPVGNRRFVFGTADYGNALKDSLFVQADQSGSTTALERAQLGHKFGFDTYWTQQIPAVVGTEALSSLAFHREAAAFITRMIAPPEPGTGGVGAVVPYEGYSVTVTKSYKGRGLGTDIVFEALYGGKLIDANKARLVGN